MTQDEIVSLAKRRGFIYPGSEIYGGLANTYDYGPAGVELLRNIKNLWWNKFVTQRDDVVGLDASIISSHKVWDASGHTSGFADAMVDCKNCKSRFRADHLIEDFIEANGDQLKKEQSQNNLIKIIETGKVEGVPHQELTSIIKQLKIKCAKCKKEAWTEVRKFNLLFPINLGIIEGDGSLAYLRGETAQGIFINFKNVADTTRVKLPFSIAQVGKSFRNEITLGNSVFRTVEFEQGEIESFFNPELDKWEEIYEDWKKAMWSFVTEDLGISKDNLRWRVHTDEERSFYSKKTEDLEYKFPFGFKELWGLAYRTDYDLKQHSEHSGQDLSIVDPRTNKKVLPHVIEPAVGINRLFLMILTEALVKDGERTVLKIKPSLAPSKAAVFPLLANKDELITKAKKIHTDLQKSDIGHIAWDDRGNIGKRYLSQDEAGTPYCVTIDFQSLEDDTVTIRDRNTAKQDRVKAVDLPEIVSKRLK